MKKTVIADGLNGILNLTPDQEQKPKKEKKEYISVCYSINPELAEKIRYIAYYDRKKINAVVNEAFEQYINSWTPAPQEKPKKL